MDNYIELFYGLSGDRWTGTDGEKDELYTQEAFSLLFYWTAAKLVDERKRLWWLAWPLSFYVLCHFRFFCEWTTCGILTSVIHYRDTLQCNKAIIYRTSRNCTGLNRESVELLFCRTPVYITINSPSKSTWVSSAKCIVYVENYPPHYDDEDGNSHVESLATHHIISYHIDFISYIFMLWSQKLEWLKLGHVT